MLPDIDFFFGMALQYFFYLLNNGFAVIVAPSLNNFQFALVALLR